MTTAVLTKMMAESQFRRLGAIIRERSEPLRDLGVSFENPHAPEGFCYRKTHAAPGSP